MANYTVEITTQQFDDILREQKYFVLFDGGNYEIGDVIHFKECERGEVNHDTFIRT